MVNTPVVVSFASDLKNWVESRLSKVPALYEVEPVAPWTPWCPWAPVEPVAPVSPLSPVLAKVIITSSLLLNPPLPVLPETWAQVTLKYPLASTKEDIVNSAKSSAFVLLDILKLN